MIHSHSTYEVPVEEAIRRGRQRVNYPAMAIIVIPLVLIWLSPDAPDLLWPPALVGTVVAAWLWWSWSLPRWRVWALENVEDLDAFISAAVAEQLMWPPGHLLEKTEIRSDALRRRERAIMQRRVAEKRRELDRSGEAF